MKVAVTQMTSGGVIKENLAVALSLVSRAVSAGAEAVFLPEATDFIATPDKGPELTRSEDNKAFVNSICDAAKQHRVWISVGIHEEPENDAKLCYNTQLLVDKQGLVKAQYRKLHLYDVNMRNGPILMESRSTLPGKELIPPIETPFGRIGVSCHDH